LAEGERRVFWRAFFAWHYKPFCGIGDRANRGKDYLQKNAAERHNPLLRKVPRLRALSLRITPHYPYGSRRIIPTDHAALSLRITPQKPIYLATYGLEKAGKCCRGSVAVRD